MICKKCKKEIPDDSAFCNWCGKKQVVTKKRTTHRRARGTGTIRIDKRKASPYVAYAPRSTNSSSQQYLASFKSMKEAQLFLDAYKEENFPELYNATLSRIYELWSENHFKSLQSKNGVSGYRAAYRDLSPLHNKKMRDIKTVDFQMCLDVVSQRYGRSKCQKVKQLCSQLCKYAMQNDVIDKNYADFLLLPKEQKKVKAVFTNEELQTLWEHSDDNKVRFILFMVYTGFRIGEVSEIELENIHLAEGYIIGGNKTEAGKNRIVPLPPAVPELSDFVRYWVDNPNDSPFGVPKNSLRQYWFYPALSDLGIIEPPIYNPKTRKNEYKNPRLTPHCTRHTFASLSVKYDMSPEDLQKIIGHADFSTTANIYVHQDIATLQKAMSKIQKY